MCYKQNYFCLKVITVLTEIVKTEKKFASKSPIFSQSSFGFIKLTQLGLGNISLLLQTGKCMKSVITPSRVQAFSPDFPVRKFSVNGQFLQIFGPIAQDFLTRKLDGKARILYGVRFMPIST